MTPNAIKEGLLAETPGKCTTRQSDAPAELIRAEADASDDRSLADLVHATMQMGLDQAPYTYDEDARRVLGRCYTYLLDLDAKKRVNGSHYAQESSQEVQDG